MEETRSCCASLRSNSLRLDASRKNIQPTNGGLNCVHKNPLEVTHITVHTDCYTATSLLQAWDNPFLSLSHNACFLHFLIFDCSCNPFAMPAVEQRPRSIEHGAKRRVCG